MPIDPRRAQLLAALHVGQRLWLKTGGLSMWPLLLPGDRLLAVRCSADALEPGELAIIRYGEMLVAHLVVASRPARTASLVGVPDAPGGQALARVEAVKRGKVRLDIPPALRHLFRFIPSSAFLLKQLPGARAMVGLLRQGRPTRR